MGNKSSSMLQDDEIQLISSETEFTPTQIEKLYARFTSLDKDAVGSLSREDFLRVPELAINPLCNRIVEMFFTELGDTDSIGGGEDHDRINFRQFMKVLATFRSSPHHNHHLNNSNNSDNNHNKLNDNVKGNNKQQETNQQKQPPSIVGPGPSSSSLTTNNNNNNSNNIHNKNNNNQQHPRVEFTQANSVAILSQSHSHGDHHHLGSSHSGLNRNASSPHSMYKNGLLDVLDDHNHGHMMNRKISSPIYSLHDANSSHNWRPMYDDDEPKNSRKHKLYFMFRLYDVDNDNQISFDDLKCILKQMVGTYIDEEHTNKIVARAFMEVDKDGDNYINFDEFCQVFEGSDIDDKLRIKFSH